MQSLKGSVLMTIPYIRLARPTDVPAIMPIIESARQLLA